MIFHGYPWVSDVRNLLKLVSVFFGQDNAQLTGFSQKKARRRGTTWLTNLKTNRKKHL